MNELPNGWNDPRAVHIVYEDRDSYQQVKAGGSLISKGALQGCRLGFRGVEGGEKMIISGVHGSLFLPDANGIHKPLKEFRNSMRAILYPEPPARFGKPRPIVIDRIVLRFDEPINELAESRFLHKMSPIRRECVIVGLMISPGAIDAQYE